jgi:hypothetical protein
MGDEWVRDEGTYGVKIFLTDYKRMKEITEQENKRLRRHYISDAQRGEMEE